MAPPSNFFSVTFNFCFPFFYDFAIMTYMIVPLMKSWSYLGDGFNFILSPGKDV